VCSTRSMQSGKPSGEVSRVQCTIGPKTNRRSVGQSEPAAPGRGDMCVSADGAFTSRGPTVAPIRLRP
jgi:hypothetical protein